MRGWFGGKRTIEERLRDERPEPSSDLMRSIVTEIRGSAPRRARTPLRLAALTGAVLAGLAAVGGLGYAATYTAHVVAVITGSQAPHSTHVTASAGRAQYTTTAATTTTTASSGGAATTTATTATTTTTAGAGGEAGTTAAPGSTGSVSTENPNDTGHPISATWAADTFSAPTAVTVDPTPTLGTGVTLKVGSVLVSITATNTNTGGAVTTLAAPLEVTIGNAPAGFVPAVSTDGVNFRALTQISGPPLPADMQDAYYVASDGVHILTRHLTIFGVIAKADVTISEKGHKLAPAGSGRWGDASLVHTGAPTFVIKSGPTASGNSVKFTFFVDEQAAMYFHVLSGGKLLLLTGKSKIRTAGIGGPNQRTQHVAVLRPGTIPVTLVLKKTAAKMSIQVSAIDFDGNKVTRIASVK